MRQLQNCAFYSHCKCVLRNDETRFTPYCLCILKAVGRYAAAGIELEKITGLRNTGFFKGFSFCRRNDGKIFLFSSACYELFYTQLGVKLCSMAGGGVQKIYMVFLREPSRRDRSGSDLFHLRDGFEIKMNFDRNVSCFIFVNALMHDDFFD